MSSPPESSAPAHDVARQTSLPVLQRPIEVADGGPWTSPAPTAPWAAPLQPPTHRHVGGLSRRRRATSRTVRAVVAVTLASGSWAVRTGHLPTPPHSPPRWTAHTSAPLEGSTHRQDPTPGREEAPAPLGAPAPLARTNSSYVFLRPVTRTRGAAVTYDPCRPIHYVVREDHAPFGGDELIARAVARLSQATGLRFIADGTTDEAPTTHRASYQPDRYGDRWAPVLFAWSSPDETPDLGGDVVADSLSQVAWRDGGSDPVYVTGQVRLDAADLAPYTLAFSGKRQAQAVIEHELGHLVGLDHTSDRSQLMYPSMQRGVTDYGDGDLTGLAVLGSGACAPDV